MVSKPSALALPRAAAFWASVSVHETLLGRNKSVSMGTD